jgi:hypothetical protein
VAVPIANFISLEVGNLIDTLGRLGFFATRWLWAVIAVFGMKAVIHVAAEVFLAMEPRASTDEEATRKPLRAVVAVGSTVIGSGVIVAVGTIGRNSNLHSNLSRYFGSGNHQEASSDSRQHSEPKSSHKSSSFLRDLSQAPHKLFTLATWIVIV